MPRFALAQVGSEHGTTHVSPAHFTRMMPSTQAWRVRTPHSTVGAEVVAGPIFDKVLQNFVVNLVQGARVVFAHGATDRKSGPLTPP